MRRQLINPLARREPPRRVKITKRTQFKGEVAMTSLKQIEANRRNALRSTGPRSEDGKQRASQNAVRHGWTAETVIEPLEDPEDYKAFERAVAEGYGEQTAVERELVLRLASLLWRLRRTASIETGLMQIEGEILRECERARQKTSKDGSLSALFRLHKGPTDGQFDEDWHEDGKNHHDRAPNEADSNSRAVSIQSDVARHFLRVANLDNGVFERLGRYETALWRQVRQTLFTLDALQRHSLSARYSGQHFWRRRHAVPLEGDLSNPL
jgi:hypothetical protein